ncbi:MAG: hypothetical protein ACR2I5_02985 [Candidatus Limnocylindria bacterium]|jgi:hypothetical protein
MRLAFATGALASGFVAAGLSALVIWLVTILTGSTESWAAAPWVVSVFAAVVAGGTYFAEGIAYRRTLSRMRATGEPWAYRA